MKEADEAAEEYVEADEDEDEEEIQYVNEDELDVGEVRYLQHNLNHFHQLLIHSGYCWHARFENCCGCLTRLLSYTVPNLGCVSHTSCRGHSDGCGRSFCNPGHDCKVALCDAG